MWRVALREASLEDAEAVDPWLSEALAAVVGRAERLQDFTSLTSLLAGLGSGRRALLVTAVHDRPVGIILLSDRDGCGAVVDALAIAASDRNLGFGAEAIYTLEELHSGRCLVAGVPVTNGLAIYFWLRVGYRPVFPKPAGPALDPARVWMVRSGNEQGANPGPNRG